MEECVNCGNYTASKCDECGDSCCEDCLKTFAETFQHCPVCASIYGDDDLVIEYEKGPNPLLTHAE